MRTLARNELKETAAALHGKFVFNIRLSYYPEQNM